ncbi:MAG: MarR family transcriptional regulator [Gammaproteobacteria bacterium]|nr:MarR family transcriptional regulator [Gammaproteobacteria bacterium]
MPARRESARSAPVAAASDHDARLTVGRLIRLVYSSIRRGIDQRMQPLSLTAMQWEPVLLLRLRRADTVAALARECQIDCGGMTRMLDRLEEKQLVRRRRSRADRRVVHLQLTPQGEAVARRLLPVVTDELQIHLHRFTTAEITRLTRLLERMLANGAQGAAAAPRAPEDMA